ncbi:MAG TPA: rod shape-determining protein MreD, partial [Casimicrobiaceae bacterium]|nr:rod shape-determining protein MreD [Casimicrobiaceae bacterium]
MALPRVPPLTPIGPEVILKPASAWFVLFTLLLAMGGNLMPLSGMALAVRPDFVALVLLYWCIHEPRLIGV